MRGDVAWFARQMREEFGRDPQLYQSLLAARMLFNHYPQGIVEYVRAKLFGADRSSQPEPPRLR